MIRNKRLRLKGSALALWLGLSLLLNACNETTPTPPSSATPFQAHSFDRVMVIVLENADYKAALANPELSALSRQGLLLTNYFAVSHPSYPNYLAMVGGSTFGVTDDNPVNLDQPNLADLLEKAHLDWKVYAEGLPQSDPCFNGTQAGGYVRKHEPFVSFQNIQTNPARCSRIVNANQLKGDLDANTLPTYSLYVPDMNNDGHDTGVSYAAGWLNGFLPPLLTRPGLADHTLFVVTFDEDDNEGGSNQVFTLLLGGPIQPGQTSARAYNHYDLLRTIEDNFELGTLGQADTKAHTITEGWKKP